MPSPLADGLVGICCDYLDGHSSELNFRRHLADFSTDQLKELVRALDGCLYSRRYNNSADGKRGRRNGLQ
jgi:chromosome condensin MukBEF MukE localization factor